MQPGHIIQWGLPLGKWGRVLPLLFLRNTNSVTIWVNTHPHLKVYPPSWAAFGIDLKKFFFIQCPDPLSLKPLFFENTHDCLVIDAAKNLKPAEMAFLATRMRHNRQILFLIQNFFLSAGRGNPFAHRRLNGWFDTKRTAFVLQFIKGPRRRPLLYIPLKRVWHEAR